MNGDAQLIMNKIVEIETKQEERHTENKLGMNVVFEKLAKLDNLPCEVHAERMNSFGKALNVMTTVILLVVVLGIVFGIWIKSIGG